MPRLIPLPRDTFDFAAARHLLVRAGFEDTSGMVQGRPQRGHRIAATTNGGGLMLGMRQKIAALLLLIAWSGCAEIEPAATQGERVEVVVDVDGMVCDACSKAVVDQLKRTDGVVGSACSYQTKTAVITFDAGVTDFETIQARLTAIGFLVQKAGGSKSPAGAEVAPTAGDS